MSSTTPPSYRSLFPTIPTISSLTSDTPCAGDDKGDDNDDYVQSGSLHVDDNPSSHIETPLDQRQTSSQTHSTTSFTSLRSRDPKRDSTRKSAHLSFSSAVCAEEKHDWQWLSHGKLHLKAALRRLPHATLYTSLFGSRSRREATPVASNCLLLQLPMEILQLIICGLPWASQAAFALTSKSSFKATRTLPWKRLAPAHHNHQRYNFLSLLERDLCAVYWFCKECVILHHKSSDKSNCDAFFNRLFEVYFAEVTWAQVYLVMQRHLRGKDFGLPIEVLSKRYSYPLLEFAPRSVLKFVQHGKIVDGEVLIKACLTVGATPGKVKYDITICPHLDTPTREYSWVDKEFQKVLKCRLSHVKSQRKFCDSCVPLPRRCRWCAIEYTFSATNSWQGPTLHITVWANLGSGQDTNDPKWMMLSNFRSYRKEPLNYELGSIRSKYELER